MEKTPFFSILVPTYNQAQYLGEALDSVLAQTDSDWEAVIVNDGSTDSTPQVLEQYAQKDPRFKIFHQENGGTGSALNMALKFAQGQWICWLSSDDLFETKKLEIHRQWINKYPEYKFFFSNFRQLVGTTGKIINLNPNLTRDIPKTELQVLEIFKRNYIPGNSICIFRDAWLQVGKFNEKLKYAQDYDMWFRLVIDYPAFYIPEFTYLQRIYSEQASNQFSDYCYFDSAKASIEILNQYNFQQLFPYLAEKISKNDKKLFQSFLKKLFNLDSFTYWLGFHPLLLFRLMEWISTIECDRTRYNLKLLLTSQLELEIKKNYFNHIRFWAEISKFILNQNYKFSYSSLTADSIAQNYYTFLNSIDLSISLSLQKYLSKVLKIDSDQCSFEHSLKNLVNKSLILIRDKNIENKIESVFEECFNFNTLISQVILLEDLDFSIKNFYQFLLSKKVRFTFMLYFLLFLIKRAWRYTIQGVFFDKLILFIKFIIFTQNITAR